MTKDNVAAATNLLGAMVSSVPSNVDGAKGAMHCALSAAAAAPDEVLMEHLHDAAYLDTPMGMSVLGTDETVAKLSANDVSAFAAKNVTAARTVVAAAGAVDTKAFAEAAVAAFGGLSAGGASAVDASMAPATFTGSDKRLRFDSFPSAHVAVVFEGAAHGSPDAVAQAVMGAYLGSFDAGADALAPKNRTSRLTSDQGEQLAAHSLKVINASYKDSGLFGVYFNAPDNRLEDGMWYTLWNMVRLVHKTTDADVAHAKTQLKAQLAKAAGTSSGLAADLAKSIRSVAGAAFACLLQGLTLLPLRRRVDRRSHCLPLLRSLSRSTVGRAVSLKEMFARIDAVDAAAVKAVAKKVVNDNDHALAAAGPIYELPDYNWIRRRSYWLRY